jgi:hypothetical protein
MSAPAGLFNLVADQGSTFSRTIVWKDPAKAPILLGGYTARMQIRPISSSSTLIKELTTENGGITLGAINGQIVIYISDEDMVNIAEDKYVYDLELAGPNPDTYVYKLLYGNFVVRSEVTR